MTQKEKLIALLDEMGVFYVEANGLTEDMIGIPAKPHVPGTYKNAGYRGFSADLSFDKDGNLKEFGIWE